AAVRDQRVVGAELSRDALRLEDPLGTQHLLHLVLHREPILEAPGDIRPDRELPLALVTQHPCAKCWPLAGVLLEPHQVRGRKLVHITWVRTRAAAATADA